MSDLLAGVRLAVGTLTVVPTGPIRTDGAAPRWAMILAPLAVLPLAAAVTLIGVVLDFAGVPDLVAAGLVVGSLGWLNRGMHLDGLADTVDGLAAGWDRERALRIMHTGDVGPMGAAALIVVMLVQTSAVYSLVLRHGMAGWLLLGGAVVASRGVCALGAMRGIPAAAVSGMGEVMAGTVPRSVTASVAMGCGAALALIGIGVVPPAWSVLAALAGFAAAALFLRRCLRTFGGITGDIFGAMIEVALVAVLVTLSAAPA